jgi:hypothetical protein
VLPQTAAADVSGEALATDSADGPSTTDNNDGQQRELALAVANDGSTAPSVTGEDDSGDTPVPERSTQPCELALVEGSALTLAADKEVGTQAPLEGSAPPLVADKEDGTQAPSEASPPALVVVKEDGTQPEGSAPGLGTNKEHGTQAPLEGCEPPLVADKEDGTQTPLKGSAPARVADKDDFTEPLFTKHKRGRRTCRSAPAKATHAPAWTSIAENMAGSKALSAPPKGNDRQCKPASVQIKPRKMLLLNADRPVPIKPRKMLVLNVDPPVPIKPQKMLLLNADEVPDHPGFCVLALPAPVPTATKA